MKVLYILRVQNYIKTIHELFTKFLMHVMYKGKVLTQQLKESHSNNALQ